MDPRVFQQEIQEAADMTPEELDQAARDLIRRSGSHMHSSDSPPPEYYPSDDMRDYGSMAQSLRDRHHHESTEDEEEDEEDEETVVQQTTAL